MPILKVRDLMSDQVIALQPSDSLRTLSDIMLSNHIRHVPVVDGESQLLGLVSHRDLLRASLIEQPDMTGYMEKAVLERIQVREVMTEVVESIDPEADVRDAAQLMLDYKYGCLPVTEGQLLVGILTESDFVRFMAHGE